MLAGQQTFNSWNALGTSSTRTLGETAPSFTFDADIQLSSTGVLNGQFTDNIDSQIDVYAAITAVTGLVGEADLNFALTAKLGTSTSGVVVTLDEFELSLV